MKIIKEFVGWTYCICKECKQIFPFYDKNGKYNDTPPDNKFYCPECIKKGFKNKKEKNTPDKYLKRKGVTNKIVIREFKKIHKVRGKHRSFDNILKEALEVAEYYE